MVDRSCLTALIIAGLICCVFCGVGLATAPITVPVSTDSSFAAFEGYMGGGGQSWRFDLPLDGVSDSFYIGPIDVTEWGAIGLSYRVVCVLGTADSTSRVRIYYEQAPYDSSVLYSVPAYHADVEVSFIDSSGTVSTKSVHPGTARYMRLCIFSEASHDIGTGGTVVIFLGLFKQPLTHFQQYGHLYATRITIPSNAYGLLGRKYFEFYLSDNGDTLHAEWQGGGPDRRTVWENPFYTGDTFQPRTQVYMNNSIARFSYGTPVDVTVAAANDSIEVTRVWHRLIPASGSLDSIETIGDGETFQLGAILILTVKGSGKTIVFDDGIDNIQCGGDFTMDSQADTICLMKISTGQWAAVWKEDN